MQALGFVHLLSVHATDRGMVSQKYGRSFFYKITGLKKSAYIEMINYCVELGFIQRGEREKDAQGKLGPTPLYITAPLGNYQY
jgi:hypothetical protein